VRQGRCDTCQHEASHPEDEQHAHREVETVMADPHEGGDTDDEQPAQEIGVDEHLTTPPFVEEDTGEGTDERIGKEEHGEGTGDGRRRRLTLR
jgi:hypothetical protein